MNLPQLSSWLVEWAGAWSVPDLADRVHFEMSSRMRTSLGRCYPQTGKVRLNTALLDEPEELLREVACHEAAHVAVYLLHGNAARPHGREWKELMAAAGFAPRVRMDPTLLSHRFQRAARPRSVYRHHCPVCGASRTARRPVHRWRCRACRQSGLEGKLSITSLAGS